MAVMIMLLPIVTITIFEAILIRRESADGLGGTVLVGRISSAPGRSVACFETSGEYSNGW